MSQDEILKLIQNEPGILQIEVYKRFDICKGSVSDQIRRLARKNLIYREYVPRTWKLYPVTSG